MLVVDEHVVWRSARKVCYCDSISSGRILFPGSSQSSIDCTAQLCPLTDEALASVLVFKLSLPFPYGEL